MPTKILSRSFGLKKEGRTATPSPTPASRTVLFAQQGVQTAAPKPVPRTNLAPCRVQAKGRSEIEIYFERLRAMDRLEGKDAFGTKGLNQLCRDIGITPGTFEMYVLVWKIGTSRSGCIPRTDWISSMYAYHVENPMDLKIKMIGWAKEAKTTDFVEFYSDLYDYARGEDVRLMPCETAVNLWRILFADEKRIYSWIEWYSGVYKQDVSRDVWKQLSVFFASVPDVSTYEVEDKWPIAIDKYVEWCRKPKGTR